MSSLLNLLSQDAYRINVEHRLSTLETELGSLIRSMGELTKSTQKLERIVAKLTLTTPIISILLFVLGVVLGTRM